MLTDDKPVLNGLGLFIIDVPNNEDEANAGLVFAINDGEVLAENAGPNIPVLVDDVNGLELATGVLLNSEEPVEAGLGANGLFAENGFGLGWLNGLFVGVKGFCCADDGKLGTAAEVPEGFGPPLSPRW